MLGKLPYIPSRAEYKRAVLTSQLCLLTVIICLIFCIIDLTEGFFLNLPVQLICAALAIVSMLLNRHGKHTVSKILLIISVNLTVYIYSEIEPLGIGLYLFFIVSNIGLIAAFGFEGRKLAAIFISFSFMLFFISLYTDLPFVTKVTVTQDYITFNLLINFVISFVASTLIIYFLIDLNYRSEKTLKENERQMIIKNEELTKLNAELDKFTYSTSHDLRSPISSVLGLIQLAKMTNQTEEIKGYVEMMEGRLATLNKFIKDISDYSRNARTEVNRESVEVRRLIQDIVDDLKFYPGAERVKVDIEIDNLLKIESDPTRLRIIFSNLIANSFKYADPHKEKPFIRISGIGNNKQVHFRVVDNGVGIPENYLPKVFDMFFQAHDKSEGSGLGLYIVKESVGKLNGTIVAKSKLEAGSEFDVSLPNQ